MKSTLLLFVISFLAPFPTCAQQPAHEKDNDLGHKDSTITGCLTKNALKEYELVDEQGRDNLPYSTIVDLDNNSENGRLLPCALVRFSFVTNS